MVIQAQDSVKALVLIINIAIQLKGNAFLLVSQKDFSCMILLVHSSVHLVYMLILWVFVCPHVLPTLMEKIQRHNVLEHA